MADRRMFSKKIINTAKYLRLPVTTRDLYFFLTLWADDDGIVEAFPIMKLTDAQEDDLKLLVTKDFVKILDEDMLIVVITDWLEHNKIRADRKVDSIYKDLLKTHEPNIKTVEAKETYYGKTKNKQTLSNKSSIFCQTNDGQMTDNCQTNDGQMTDNCQTNDGQMTDNCQPFVGIGKDRLGKDRLGKDSKEKEREVQSRVTITPPIPPYGGKGESEKNSDDIIGEGPKAEECLNKVADKTEEEYEPPKREQLKAKEPPKTKYAEFVSMTEEEHEKLVEEYGEDGAAECIAILDNYKGSTGKRYKSDYRAILSWVVERYKERHMARPIARPKQQRDLNEILQELRGGQHED